MPTITAVDAIQFNPLTQAQWDALDGQSRLLAYVGTTERLEMKDPTVQSVGIPVWPLPPVHYDALVDNTISESVASRVPKLVQTIQEAIDNDAVSVLVNNAGDGTAITVASVNNLQRLHGLDSDTTLLPVSTTINKDNVTVEQLGLSGVTLTVGANVMDATLAGLFTTATGAIDLQSGSSGRLLHSRFYNSTATPLLWGDTQEWLLLGNLFDGNTGANHIAFDSAGNLQDLAIIANLFLATTAVTSDYNIRSTSTGTLIRPTFALDKIEARQNGGIDLEVINAGVLGNSFRALTTLDAGKRLIRLTDDGGSDIQSRVIANHIQGTVVEDVLFDYAGADAQGAGLILGLNTFLTGTVLGSQDALWYGNDMAGITVNFQSKTGIYVICGDMTGATLQNIPADLYMWGVKGQNNRGHNLPAVTNSYDFGSAALRMRKIWTVDLDASGDTLIGSDLTLGATLRNAYGLVVENASSLTALGVSNARMGVVGGLPNLILETTSGTWAIDTLLNALRFMNAGVQYHQMNTAALLTLGYHRIGATAAPANTTAGDLTCVRLNVGNVAFPAGIEAYISGDLQVTGQLELDGALNHDGTTIGFFGVTPAVRAAAYTITNVTTDRAYDADLVLIAELADVLGTLIADLKLYGILQ